MGAWQGHDRWVGRQGGPTHRGRRQGASCVALPRAVTSKTDVFIFLPSDTRQVNIRLRRCGGREALLLRNKYCELRVIRFLGEARRRRGGSGRMGGRAAAASSVVAASQPPIKALIFLLHSFARLHLRLASK